MLARRLGANARLFSGACRARCPLPPIAVSKPGPRMSTISASQFTGNSADELRQWLETYGVDTALYGQGTSKRVDDLLEEAQKKESILSVETGRALRIVQVLSLHIINGQGQVLYEEEQVLPDGRSRRRNLPLSEKLIGSEHWREAVHRAVSEEMGSILATPYSVKVHEETYRLLTEFSSSMSYPGLLTKYICHRVDVNVSGLPDFSFSTTEERPGGHLTTHWVWRTLDDLEESW